MYYTTPGKYTFDVRGVKTALVTGINNKHQINATFSISMSRKFLQLEVIYSRKTKRFLPK